MNSLSSQQVSQLQSILASPAIASNPISGFTATVNATTGGVDVSFSLTDGTGIALVTLLRNKALDPATATVLQSWATLENGYAWSDTDALLQSVPQVYYWLSLSPVGSSGNPSIIGPQQVSLNPQTGAPNPILSISASHGAAANGYVTVTVNASPVPDGGSVQITATGYNGNPNAVTVAQSASSPLQFSLKATGETVTLKALAVSAGGTATSTGPTTTITLNSAFTVPAAPQGVTATQISTGNQITFPANRDTVTSYSLYRGLRGGMFSGASMLASLTSASGTIQYLDTGGLGGDFAYYVVAVNALGSSAPSAPASPTAVYSSSSLPPNAVANPTNNAKVDSVSASGSALIRIYGPGGVGTGFTYYVGAAALSLPNGTISGNAYKTQYAVVYDTVSQAFFAYLMTNYPSTLPDQYRFIGYHTTVSTGSASGSGATATAVIGSGGTVVQVNVTAGGAGYDNAEVDFSGGGGSGAQATANISTFTKAISSITVTNGGSGYTTAPTVTIVALNPGQTTGGGGSSTIFNGGARYPNDPSLT